jgi:hypothetical protein
MLASQPHLPRVLSRRVQDLGSWWYRQEYECEFVDTLDQVFTYETVMGALTSGVQPLFSSFGA